MDKPKQTMQKTAHIYSVSDVNLLIKATLDTHLPAMLVVKGEISGWAIHSSGHCYFSLKDEDSVLPAAMWKPSIMKLKFKPENGMEVLAAGFVDVYVPRGNYKFIVEEITPAGVGALQLAFEQMVKKLQAEGLFDDEHKKAIPEYPQRIGILTSPTGAAVHDIEESIHSRWPCVKLYLYSVPVQGEGAAKKIADALRDVNRRNKKLKLDLLIVGRGGGSLEDLWAFNEEVVARAIFASKIPVISAVGHEVDTTIADLVADSRASTPTKAGVVAVPDMYEVLEQLSNFEQILSARTKANLELARKKLDMQLASSVFRNPMLIVRLAEQRLDELSSGLAESLRILLAQAHRILSLSYEQLVRIEPHRLIGDKKLQLNHLQNRTQVGIKSILNKKTLPLNLLPGRIEGGIKSVFGKLELQLGKLTGRLEGLNPKSVLKRGYSISISKETGNVIKSPDDIKLGDLLITELAGENLIESQVIKK
jgi:exodeoxyribonuclease VII large subunit